ncbi:uncharacterized protein LOC118212563 [Anguilla anguilla]|uniref:uncharacterized protein LOC118212563 n=1 Tax=Anguilla anguilla TaxID=7936 RepID=UPI0015ABD98A|nr:uncharacterized protein LOC118212563 [Anguilla anguilla]
MHLSDTISRSRKREQTQRLAHRTDYYYHGHRICRDVFKYLHGVGQDKLNALMKHCKAAGVEARVHKLNKRLPANALKLQDTRAIVDFILNYAEANAIILPGCTPRHWKADVKLLPTNCSKRTVCEQYCAAVENAGMQMVTLRTFRRIWQQLVPFVSTMRPATDLCWYCQSGKGANCVVSLLHYFFEHYGMGEEDVHLHADNCSGQNKNSTMMWYLMWRVLTGRHKNITFSFLLAGHTKFSCDWCFALVKRLFRRTRVDCLNDIVKVVEESSHVNIAQVCGKENGEVIVPTYDWTSFLSTYFRKVGGIKKNHHFHFREGSGIIEIKEFCDSGATQQDLLRGGVPLPSKMPDQILPKDSMRSGSGTSMKK